MKKQLRGGRINRINPIIQQIISNELLRNSDPILNKSTITVISSRWYGGFRNWDSRDL